MYDETVPVFIRNLEAMKGVLDKGEAHFAAEGLDAEPVLRFAFHETMWPLHRQIQAACDHCRRTPHRLALAEPPEMPDAEVSFDGLRARVAIALDEVRAVDRGLFDRAPEVTTRFSAGPYQLELKGPDYIRNFIMPNLYFHFTVAYAILRHHGVPLGKIDFIGAI